MKRENSLALIERLQEQVERHIQVMVSDFQNRTADRLLRPSASGGWSIVQCLQHLNSYGDFYLPEIKKALAGKSAAVSPDVFKSGWLGRYFTRMMDPAGSKKYKAFKNHIPAARGNAEEVIAECIRQQEMLLAYLHQARKKDLRVSLPISISPFIRLQLGDVFQFLIMHNERHLQQALRNI